MIPRGNKTWSPAEEEYIRENWGSYGGVFRIAKALGRSENAVIIHAKRLGLGPYLDEGRYISLFKLLSIIIGKRTESGCVSYTYRRLINLGIPFHKIRVVKSLWRMVDLDEFWMWAEDHKEELNFSRFEENSLGAEPEWVKKKRKIDQSNSRMTHSGKCRWTELELECLRTMLKNGATYEELSKQLRRTSGAIRRKIYDLYLPHPTGAKQVKWQKAEISELMQMTEEGFNVDYCAVKLNRSPEAVRGKIDWMHRKGHLKNYV